MSGEQHPSKVALRAQRARVIERLSEGFVRDELDLEDYERRVNLAHTAPDVGALASLIDDLEPDLAASLPAIVTEAPVPAVRPRTDLVPAARGASGRALAVFGSIERSGPYAMVDGGGVLAVFGSAEFDLREVEFPPGVTTIQVRAYLGSVEFTVPPELSVECVGHGILGSFEGLARIPPEGSPRAVLRIVGHAVLGSVEVHTRPRGAR